jgi:SH3-like domain-containing protein
MTTNLMDWKYSWKGTADMAIVDPLKREVDWRVRELDAEKLKVWNEWILLSEDRHAVLLDWTDNAEGKCVRLMLHHYLTCTVCASRKAKVVAQ